MVRSMLRISLSVTEGIEEVDHCIVKDFDNAAWYSIVMKQLKHGAEKTVNPSFI